MQNIRNLTVIILCVLTALCSGCKKNSKDSSACINAPTGTIATGNAVTFTSCSNTATSYSWNFGDGSGVVTSDTATHTYLNPGTYTVTLTTIQNGHAETQTITVTVTQYTAAGSWTIKGQTYSGAFCAGGSTGLDGSLYTTTGDTANPQTIQFLFYDDLPGRSAFYNVNPSIPTSSTSPPSVYFHINNGTSGYLPANSTQTVNVIVNPNTYYISITGTGILLVNPNNSADTASVNFNIIQTR